VRKEFGGGLALPTVGGGGGGGGWVEQADNKNSSAATKLSFMSGFIGAKINVISR
jgi:hypothetical protein